jgi:O-antigen ligase
VAAAGSAILFAAVDQRAALDSGAVSPQALTEGDELKVILLVVCMGVALTQVAISLAARLLTRPAWMTPTRRQTAIATGLVLVTLITAGLVAGGAGEVSDAFDRFKSREETTETSRSGQLLDLSSSGRYQFWESSVDAFETKPLTGIGPGTFEFWWSREGLYPGFVRDAHSLYFESLAELGIVGFLLVAAFVLSVLIIGVARVLRGPEIQRLPMAAAVASCLAFAVAALVDWVWELSVIPIIFLILSAVLIRAGRSEPSNEALDRNAQGVSSSGLKRWAE